MMKKLLFLVFSLVLATFSFGQTPTGSLTGSVSAPDGVLPNATVQATFDTTGRSITVVTDSRGSFTFPQLEPGDYTVTVTAQGFKQFVAQKVKIDIAREYNLAVVLELGEQSETITVTAGADVISATSSQITNVVSPQQILSLPLITRDPLNLTTLQAGVASNPFQNTSINGMRTTMTNITRDGISINDAFIRANATDFAAGRPSVDDTGEFTISTGNQESDSGSGGAQISLVTPRGTKDFHGALFAYNRNSEFAANTFFNNRNGVKRPFRNRNQYGGKIGGPFPIPNFGEGGSLLSRDRGFFFFAYEGIKDPLAARATRTILTPAARGGTFTFNRNAAGTPINSGGISCPSGDVNSVCTVTNILTFAQANGIQNVLGTIDPVIMQRVINVLPAQGNVPSGIGDGLNTTGFALNRRQDTTRNMYTTRVDVDATDKDSFNAVYVWNREDVLRPDVDTTLFTESPDVTQFARNKSIVATYRRVITDSILNEFRWGLFTSEVPFARISERPEYFLGPFGTTSSTLAGLVSQTDNVFLDQGRNNKVYTMANNLNWVTGNHSLRMGFQLQKYKVNSYNDVLVVPNILIGATQDSRLTTAMFANQGGAGSIISTTQLNTANNLMGLLAGMFSQVSQGFNTVDTTSGYVRGAGAVSPFRNSNHGFYVMDRWSALRNLTITGGLRYELYPAMRLASGLSLEPLIDDPDNPAASLLAGNGQFGYLGTNAGKEFLYYKTDYNNFAPSIGVAWSVSGEKGLAKMLFGSSGRSVFRGGYSHIYANDSIITSLNNTLVGNIGLGRANVAATVNGSPILDGRLHLGIPTVQTPTFIQPPRSFLQNNQAAQSYFGVANAVDPKLQIPRTEQYSFGFQREFWGNTAFELRYVGTRSNNLTRGVDLNEIDVVSNGFLADFQRAQQNLALTGNPFCVSAGCSTLTMFQSGGTGSPGRLAIGTGVTNALFIQHLQNGTVADFAQLFITNNLNNHPTFAAPTRTPFVNLYQNPNIGQIELFTNAGSYHYNSLQAEIRRRLSSGLYFQMNYTFSKNLTDTIGTTQQLFEPYLQNDRPELDRQRADFDQTHTVNFNGIYQLPFGKGRTWFKGGGLSNMFWGGWELAGLFQMGTGAPISFVDARGTLNRGARSGRQGVNTNLTAAEIRDLMGVFEENGNIYWINPSVLLQIQNPTTGVWSSFGSQAYGNAPFANQILFLNDAGQTGSLGRTIVDGPSYWNVNATLMKNIHFTETIRVQLRAEAFNLFNNVNFNNNTQFASITSSTFGQITSAGASRQMQFALRFEF